MLVFSHSLVLSPGISIYLQPWTKEAGLATGLMALCRTIVPTAFSTASTAITARYGEAGLLVYIASLLCLTNLAFWPLLGCRNLDSNTIALRVADGCGGSDVGEEEAPEFYGGFGSVPQSEEPETQLESNEMLASNNGSVELCNYKTKAPIKHAT